MATRRDVQRAYRRYDRALRILLDEEYVDTETTLHVSEDSAYPQPWFAFVGRESYRLHASGRTQADVLRKLLERIEQRLKRICAC